MQVPNRFYNGSDYRYGFNGKEKDNELKGDGNSIDYGFRMYDSRIGRFFSVDPLASDFPELTPYQFASNTPIWAIDLDGLEAYFSNEGIFEKWGDDKSSTAPVIISGSDAPLELNVSQLLNRANWVYGEGGGNFADRYAMTIKNMKNSGKSGYGPKAFTSEEAMYKQTMKHGEPAVSLYPDYLDGTYEQPNAKAFAIAKRNPLDLNKNPKMVLSVKAVIGSLTGRQTNEGYNNWRGSGDKLYTKEQKDVILKKGSIVEYQDLIRKDTKQVYARVKTVTDHYFEPVGDKYGRHTFKKMTYEKVPVKKTK
jgi:RHS repeat-associated protein